LENDKVTREENNAQVKSREEIKKQRKEEEKQENKSPRQRRIRIRLIPIWLRLVMVIILLALSAVIGVVVGYGVIGDGNPQDAFQKSTWEHIIELVNKEK
jgi:hypothetical protein